MKVLVLFSHEAGGLVKEVRSGLAPRERLYGFSDFLEESSDIQINFSDSRFSGWFGKALTFMKKYQTNVIDIPTVRKISKCDLVVVKDSFSVLVSLACILFRKPVVYYDSMFQFPKQKLRVKFTEFCINHSAITLAYSRTQMELWERSANLKAGKIKVIDYVIDTDFYVQRQCASKSVGGNVLAVGRDVGRDYITLCEAVESSETRLKLNLVALPYLLPGKPLDREKIHYMEHIEYQRLFELYAEASVVVVPLKDGITYPSGIRAVLEAVALDRPVICTRTDYLAELFDDGEDIIFVNANDPAQLLKKMEELLLDADLRLKLITNAKNKLLNRFDYDDFKGGFLALLKATREGASE
jgi:glycosyltransferase involved in cell wall biosynthesis